MQEEPLDGGSNRRGLLLKLWQAVSCTAEACSHKRSGFAAAAPNQLEQKKADALAAGAVPA